MMRKRYPIVALLLVLAFALSPQALANAPELPAEAVPVDLATEQALHFFAADCAMLPSTTLKNARGFALPLQLALPKAQSYLALSALRPLTCAHPSLDAQAHLFKKHFIIPHSIHAPPDFVV